MRGSQRWKSKPRTSQQDIANGRVAEMVELAAVLTSHPDTAQARIALTRIANELLKKRANATIDQAIAATPSCAIAQTLQHALEAASERVVIYRTGVRAERLLFVIPIITTFDESVPETQFESALNGLNGLKGLAKRMNDRRLELAQIVLLPNLFRWVDLNAIPLSVVRERGIHFGTAAVSRGSAWPPPITQNRSFKRSTAFLRFMVGQRQLLEHDDGMPSERRLCERLQELTKQIFERSLGLSCRVQGLCAGSFHEGLYSGMWLYQEQRLDQLARASRVEARGKKSLEARVVTYEGPHRFEVWVGFFEGKEIIGGHAYRLSSRPSEDPSGCVSRITRRLEAAGIQTTALTGIVPEHMRFGIETGRKLDLWMIAIPI